MTTHRTLPSEIEPEHLDDLIADCVLFADGVIDLTVLEQVIHLPGPRQPMLRSPVVIPDRALALVEGINEYGAC